MRARKEATCAKGLPSVSERFRIASLLLILSPLFVSLTPWRPSWDDTFFLHHAVCLARGVWNVDASQMDYCLGGMFKSPLMALLLIPGGPSRGELSELSLAPFLLALATAGAVALLAWMMAIARIPWLAVLVAGAAAILCPPMWNNGAPFLIEGFFTVVVACAAYSRFAAHARGPDRGGRGGRAPSLGGEGAGREFH